MYKNQLGRRNLTDEQRAYMNGKMYDARKKSVIRNEQGRFAPSAQNGHTAKTAEQIANDIGIGRETVKRADKFAKDVDALREVSLDAADKFF